MIDLDVKGGLNGPAEFDRFAREHRFVWTPTATTRSGGLHVYFRRTGRPLKTRAGVLPGVDVRGHHGFVVLYQVPPRLADLPEVPRAVVDLVGVAGEYRSPNPPPPIVHAGECSRWGRARLERNLSELAAARPGDGRGNQMLNRHAIKIFQAVASGHIPEALARDELRRVATAVGRKPAEIEATLRSAFEYAVRNPAHPA